MTLKVQICHWNSAVKQIVQKKMAQKVRSALSMQANEENRQFEHLVAFMTNQKKCRTIILSCMHENKLQINCLLHKTVTFLYFYFAQISDPKLRLVFLQTCF